MNYMMEQSGIPKSKQRPMILEADNADYNAFCTLADIKDNIDNLVETGFNLYICSAETGNGKTSWAIKILLKYFDCVWAGNGFQCRGYFQHVPTFFNTLKDFSKSHEALKETLETVDLVVWDDIASTRFTDYDSQQLLSVIDARLLEGRSNIYTGNLTSCNALENALGSRLASRIWNCSTVVKLEGKDRRHGCATNNF